MKTKQLANILIKLLGLSLVVHGIPAVLTGLLTAVRAKGGSVSGDYWLYPASSLILMALAVFLIIKSRQVAECLFKAEDE